MPKPIQLPTEEEFKAQLDEAQQWAASVGYTEDDVDSIIKEARSRAGLIGITMAAVSIMTSFQLA